MHAVGEMPLVKCRRRNVAGREDGKQMVGLSSLESLEQSDLLLAAWTLVHHVTAGLGEGERRG